MVDNNGIKFMIHITFRKKEDSGVVADGLTK